MRADRRVVIISGTQGSTRRYRCLHLAEQLSLAEVPCRLIDLVDTGLTRTLPEGEIVILHRIAHDRFVAGVLREYRARGSTLIFDIDDLVFDPAAADLVSNPELRDPIGLALSREEIGRQGRTMVACDAALVPTRFLAERVARLGLPARVHRNAFSEPMRRLSDEARARRVSAPDRVVVVYASGTPTHNRDFQVAAPALRQLLKEHPQVDLWVVGYLDIGPGWDDRRDRLRRIRPVPWTRLPAILAACDVNIAPLETGNAFCRAKSEIKYVEAALVGVPTVASRTEAFEDAIRQGDNGFLAATDREWVDALERLVGDASFRREMGERARADVLARYNPQTRAQEILATLAAVRPSAGWAEGTTRADSARRGDGEDRTAAGASRDGIGLFRRARYSLRYRGPRVLLMEIWVFVARWLRIEQW